MPVGMDKPQAIVIGSKVYVGGGATWKVIFFAMAQFAGNLITVGGRIQTDGLTGKVQQHCKDCKLMNNIS